MAILPGKRLGPYEILSAIGAGGMGEVYKARDTRLDRTVAIKVLPTHLADRAELRERFEREAKTIASLNHPHICTLFDTGHQDDVDFLVMEYIEGETLAQRLQRGALPIQQVLQFAIEIADALDKAHRKGITHRDLKPGNIMLTKSGTKLLDFGLAKLAQEAAPVTPLSQLPTMQNAITSEGTILGTLQYMAPEQVEAKEVDARTDIFAFGAVVYEMATGKKSFEGKTSASVMAKILEVDPPSISSLQPMTPLQLDRVVKTCMAKDPDDRWQTASDLCRELKWISEGGSQASIPVAAAAPAWKMNLRWVAALAIAIAAAVGAALYVRRSAAPTSRAVRFTVEAPEKEAFEANPAFLSISPDGSKLAFVAGPSTNLMGVTGASLWIRSLDSPTAQALPGTEGASQPFWSPDSQFVGFFAGGHLKKISVSGGPPQTLADAPSSNTAGASSTAGTWSRDGIILFTANIKSEVINRVSESGGAAMPVTTLDSSRSEIAHLWPQFLPDGKHFLYLSFGTAPGGSAIYAASLDSKESKLILKNTIDGIYSSAGYLLFTRQGTLMAQPFDTARLQLTGEAVPIAEAVQSVGITGRAAFTVSDNGELAYRGGGGAVPLTLAWVNRNGTEQRIAAPGHNYVLPRLSPDGQRLAVGIEEAEAQIWIYDLARDALTRLTFEGGGNVDPVWTPDGKRIVFKGNRNRLFWLPSDGSGPAEELTSSEMSSNNVPGGWSPDGRELAITEDRDVRKIWILPLQDRKPHSFVDSPTYDTSPRFSPDGHWIAYSSNESGRYEIYVRPYPGPGGKWQISTEGGSEPVWNPKGHELFYRQGQRMFAVDYSAEPAFSAGKPKVLFEGPYVQTPRSFPDYDVSSDGQRFLMLKAPDQAVAPAPINVVLNWSDELKQKAPAGGK
jgi:Tol biopolymer transport system component/predicted Ser/Thr protein kinase